jgi:hypothetical protein
MGKLLFTQLFGLEPTPENIAIIIVGGVFAMLGLAVNRLISVRKAIKENPQTPSKFSLKYFITDNWTSIVLSLLLLFVGLRFTQELLGVDITMWVAFGIGFGLDKLTKIIEDKIL